MTEILEAYESLRRNNLFHFGVRRSNRITDEKFCKIKRIFDQAICFSDIYIRKSIIASNVES